MSTVVSGGGCTSKATGDGRRTALRSFRLFCTRHTTFWPWLVPTTTQAQEARTQGVKGTHAVCDMLIVLDATAAAVVPCLSPPSLPPCGIRLTFPLLVDCMNDERRGNCCLASRERTVRPAPSPCLPPTCRCRTSPPCLVHSAHPPLAATSSSASLRPTPRQSFILHAGRLEHPLCLAVERRYRCMHTQVAKTLEHSVCVPDCAALFSGQSGRQPGQAGSGLRHAASCHPTFVQLTQPNQLVASASTPPLLALDRPPAQTICAAAPLNTLFQDPRIGLGARSRHQLSGSPIVLGQLYSRLASRASRPRTEAPRPEDKATRRQGRSEGVRCRVENNKPASRPADQPRADQCEGEGSEGSQVEARALPLRGQSDNNDKVASRTGLLAPLSSCPVLLSRRLDRFEQSCAAGQYSARIKQGSSLSRAPPSTRVHEVYAPLDCHPSTHLYAHRSHTHANKGHQRSSHSLTLSLPRLASPRLALLATWALTSTTSCRAPPRNTPARASNPLSSTSSRTLAHTPPSPPTPD